MIFDILYIVGGGVLQAISGILAVALPFNLPTAFYSGITAAFQTLGFFGGIFDLPVLFQCIYWFVLFEIVWITLMLIWYVIGVFRSLISVGGTSGHGK